MGNFERNHPVRARQLKRLTADNERLRTQIIALEVGGGQIQNDVVATNQRLQNEIEQLKVQRDRWINTCKSEHELAERLTTVLQSAAGALQYYTEVDYHENSDVQAGYGIEVLDEIGEVLDSKV